LKRLVDRLSQWNVTMDHPDKWAANAAVLPQDKLVMSTTNTHGLERHHGRQRHWFGRFKRQSIMVSKSLEMGDRTLALLAKFWVNGHQETLIPLLP
jgi:IS1 family transposase